MCQRSENVTVGKIEFGPEQKQEIDYRIHQKLWEREFYQRQYTRGIWDALYVVFIIAVFAWTFYQYWKVDE